jgi:hypothetical protein
LLFIIKNKRTAKNIEINDLSIDSETLTRRKYRSSLKIIKENNYKIRKCQVGPNVKRKWHKGYKYISLNTNFSPHTSLLMRKEI